MKNSKTLTHILKLSFDLMGGSDVFFFYRDLLLKINIVWHMRHTYEGIDGYLQLQFHMKIKQDTCMRKFFDIE